MICHSQRIKKPSLIEQSTKSFMGKYNKQQPALEILNKIFGDKKKKKYSSHGTAAIWFI